MIEARTPIVVVPNPFGPYSIVKSLPKGGMGRVYLALDTAHEERQVALKLIEHGQDIGSVEVMEAERRGADLQQQLAGRDTRVVRIYETGDFAGFFYIAMEYVEGRDLAEVLREGPMSPERAIAIAADILEVLANAHTAQMMIGDTVYQGIVHGDIKPRNIRLTPEGKIRILDFGIAKALSLTREYTRNQFGSTLYSSPERLASGDVDVASDLWAAAVVLYEMLAGHPYFEDQQISRLEADIRTYRQVKAMPPSTPAALRAVLSRALDPQENRRYITAGAFHDDLRAIQAGLPTNAEMRDFEAEATRRTSPAEREFSHDVPTEPIERDDQATRRTVPVNAPPPLPLPVTQPSAPTVPQTAQRRPATPSPLAAMLPPFLRLHGPLLAKIALVFLAGYPIWHEYRVYTEASALSQDLAAERIKDINDAWSRYQDLAQRNYLPLVLYGPRKRLREKFLSSADQVLADFRDSDTPSVTLADWKRAQSDLSHALELSPDDNTIKGKLRVAEGHVLRINAGGRNPSSKLMNESRLKFEEARDLWKKAPDPYLGLARVYIYGMKDIDRGEESVREAERRGHAVGRREKAQLADGYRERADQFAREASQARTSQEAQDYLSRAQSDYQRSENLYGGIVPFPGAAAGLRRAQESRERVEQRKQELSEAERNSQLVPQSSSGGKEEL